MTTRQLRFTELVIFGWTAAYFVRAQHVGALHCAARGYIQSPVGMWSLLVFTYAIFIPNSWRRAAVILGLMAAMPVAWLAIDILCYPQIGDVATRHDFFSGARAHDVARLRGASVDGTYMIGNLPRECTKPSSWANIVCRHLIGAGGMGEVYLAEHQMLKRPSQSRSFVPAKPMMREPWPVLSARCGQPPR